MMARHGGPQGWSRGGQGTHGRPGFGGPAFGGMPGRGGRGPHNTQFASRGPVDRSKIAEAIFQHLDADHDGSITKAEFTSAHGRMHGPADGKSHGSDRDGAKKKADGKQDAGKKKDKKGDDDKDDDDD